MSALVLFVKIFLVTTRQLFFLCAFFSTVSYLRKPFLRKVIKLLYSTVSHSHVMPLLALE